MNEDKAKLNTTQKPKIRETRTRRVRVVSSLVFYVLFCRSLIVPFRLVIVLFVLLRFADSDNRTGIHQTLLTGIVAA